MIMEQWEIDLRAKLETELELGMYNISYGNWVLYTGKDGKINCLIAEEKWRRELMSIEEQIKEPAQKDKIYPSECTEQDLKDIMDLLIKKGNDKNGRRIL